MILFPAVDIQEGKVVRLLRGKFDQVTEYSGAPAAMAKLWESKGAQWLHVVDLDGAKTGSPQNMDLILKIARSVNIPVQTGGGIRTAADIEKLVDGGIDRVILSTKAIEERSFLKEAIAKWKDKIAVSLDCSNGMLAKRGWTSTSDVKAVDFAKELSGLGLSCLVYTDIACDGMLAGPNFNGLKELAKATTVPVIASGGISSLEDIRQLLALKGEGVIGAIVGRAIYEGQLNFGEALKLCSRKE